MVLEVGLIRTTGSEKVDWKLAYWTKDLHNLKARRFDLNFQGCLWKYNGSPECRSFQSMESDEEGRFRACRKDTQIWKPTSRRW